ncbi:unnamed protein product [Mytilus coruscus]|uniref:B box-type domain-containing protein n=1 Tax=Mytilus coruscus TaxID=42192 RepID=A0A6J8BLA3_MYTCO|nr:unnamed protein product [Mytilus coruscus]
MAQVSAQKCLLCDESNGAYYCFECQNALCTDCRSKHGKIPALNRHTVVDINTIDISTINKKSQCIEHEKEFLFYCVKCSDLICSQCVTSTHNTHPFSEITDIVLKEREEVKEHIQELTLNINKISSLHEQVKINHQNQQLHAKSTQCIKNIESVCKDLQSFIESKRGIKVTEVGDNKQNEEDKFEASLKNMDSVQKRYTHILSELENLLFEKHDVTFHSCHRSMQSDIQTLVDMPEEPPF